MQALPTAKTTITTTRIVTAVVVDAAPANGTDQPGAAPEEAEQRERRHSASSLREPCDRKLDEDDDDGVHEEHEPDLVSETPASFFA